jgi:hypothetical protein
MAGSAAKVGLGAVLALGLVLAAPLSASAHIRVSPGQVAAGATNVQLTFSVPTEAVDAPEGERTTLVRNHTRRVLNRRKPAETVSEPSTDVVDESEAAISASAGVSKPAPGARPVRPSRPSGKRDR